MFTTMPAMKGSVWLQAVLILLCSTGVSAQRPEPRTDTTDAYNILQGKFLDDCTPDGDVPGIVKELQAIRKAVPALGGVHAMGRYVARELMFSPDELLGPSLTDEEKASGIHRLIVNPTATGIEKLDKLNKQFGVLEIVDTSLPGDWLSIQFGKPLDMGCVAEFYRSVAGDMVEPNLIAGDGDRILRAQKPGEPVHYVFRIGSGDCPAGCIEETVTYLNLYPEGQGYRIEKVDGPARYHSLWGYPDRFPLRIFNDFDDLVKQTASPDSSMRLHAVAALGRVYATGRSGRGEDDLGERDEPPAMVKHTAAIIEAINQNRDRVKSLLEEIAGHDSDDDARRAAKAALRAEEFRHKQQ